MSTRFRKPVAPPLFTPPSYTLLDYVQWVDDPDPHWQLGISYEVFCGATGLTFDRCIAQDSNEVANPRKLPSAYMQMRGATPFTVYAEIDCSPPGFWDNAEANVAAQLARTESYDVEFAFWSGAVSGVGNIALPHLASNAAIIDSDGVTLQTAASVPVTGTFDVVEGLGVIEQYLADCYVGTGLIYVTLPVFEELVNALVVFRSGARWITAKGNYVVPGGGFPGTSPAGAAPATGTAWMYATGALMGYRTNIRQFNTLEESFNRQINTLSMIVERTYVLGWDCCHGAVLVSTGGIITGTANSAT